MKLFPDTNVYVRFQLLVVIERVPVDFVRDDLVKNSKKIKIKKVNMKPNDEENGG